MDNPHTNIRVFSGIGRIQLVAEFDRNPIPQEIARFSIPDEILGEVVVECLRRAYHNNHLSDEHKKTLIEFFDLIQPTIYIVHLFDEDTDEDGRFQAAFSTLRHAAQYVLGASGQDVVDRTIDDAIDSIMNDMGLMDGPIAGWRITEEKLNEYTSKSKT